MSTEVTFPSMEKALESIGVHLVCDKHAFGADRCKGSGFVCSAHRHVPPAPLVHGGCECGAPVMTCAVARTAPIVARFQVPGRHVRLFQEVLCTVRG